MAKIAILGFGTVGSGVLEVLRTGAPFICRRAGEEVEVKYILDVRDFSGHPDAALFVKDMDIILNDPEIRVVVETIGGTRFAYPYVKAALESGRSVATSNKEMVAAHGAELLGIAREKGVAFLFEASVGGGTPLLGPMHQSLAADRITGVRGIVNGTTNFILTKMEKEGLSFEEALKKAQELGYAETRDPSDDIDGIDACRKLAILAGIMTGREVRPQDIPTRGIREVTAGDIRAAGISGCAVKLIAHAGFAPDGSLSAGVEPMLVPRESRLFGVDDVFNAVLLTGDMTGDLLFYGKGAGKLATASAVAADVMAALKYGARLHDTLFWEPAPPASVPLTDPTPAAYYVRVRGVPATKMPELFGPGYLIVGAAQKLMGSLDIAAVPVERGDEYELRSWTDENIYYRPDSLTAAQLDDAEQKLRAQGGSLALALRRLEG